MGSSRIRNATLPSPYPAPNDSKAWMSIRSADGSQRLMMHWIADAQLHEEVVPFVRELTGRLRDAVGDSASPNLCAVEGVAATARFCIDRDEVRIDCRDGFRMGPKALKLRMLAVPARTALKDALCEQAFAPHRYQALGVEVLWMKGPDPHCRVDAVPTRT